MACAAHMSCQTLSSRLSISKGAIWKMVGKAALSRGHKLDSGLNTKTMRRRAAANVGRRIRRSGWAARSSKGGGVGTVNDDDRTSAVIESVSQDLMRLPEEFDELRDLVDRGVLRIWRRGNGTSSGYGARGSGHSGTTYRQHVEPEEIYVVGTAHVSTQSAEDVERVIHVVKPDNVVVELCRSRSGTMYAQDNESVNALGLSGGDFRQAIARSLKLGGLNSLILRSLMANASPKSIELLERSGVDFRAARRAAEKVGAQLVLGDRPVEITLERAWEALTWSERLNLINLLLKSWQLRNDKGDDIMESLEEALSDSGEDLLQKYENLGNVVNEARQ
eukprot:CAMPEP_0184479656 /NCGR_PEP_ID=MMETSP0113_2-20130426/1292_1 /TAXON_ID=91329 /ORGANISM="Norrisiella sphaerica, Strain BC52" /LENGTH=334 /DNA_ID=CAMNT_0026857781 /DNA_START=154 /DNA_END=1158 /DNA_ORIENTATION=+